MDEATRNEIAALGGTAHALTESAYRRHAARRGDPDWLQKQRILLADMALHLLQSAMKDGDMREEELKRNLYAILTVSDQFLPGHGLRAAAGQLQTGVPPPAPAPDQGGSTW